MEIPKIKGKLNGYDYDKLNIYLEENLGNRHLTSSTMLCRVFATKGESFFRSFNILFGMTISEYLFLRRMQKAKELLMDTKKSPEDISEMVAYSTVHSFMDAFEKHYKIDVYNYRERPKTKTEMLDFDSIEDYIETYLNDNKRTTVANLSKVNSVSETVFWVTFKRRYGVSVGKYILQKRMEKATKLLSETQRSAAEISDMLGYAKPSLFIRIFKKTTGKTPIEYRNSQ